MGNEPWDADNQETWDNEGEAGPEETWCELPETLTEQ